jgi:hypothetical protein
MLNTIITQLASQLSTILSGRTWHLALFARLCAAAINGRPGDFPFVPTPRILRIRDGRK